VLPHPERARGHSKAKRGHGAIFIIEVKAAKQIPVIGVEFRKRLTHHDPSFLAHQAIERTGAGASGVHPLHLRERPLLASPGSIVVEAEVSRRLEDEARQRVEVLDTSLAQCLGHPAEHLLGQVLSQERVAKSAGSKDAKTLPEPFGEVPFECLKYQLRVGHGQPYGGAPESRFRGAGPQGVEIKRLHEFLDRLTRNR